MNLVERIALIFSGPTPANSYYGDSLWIVNIYLVLTAENDPLFLMKTLGLIALHFLLNLYQVKTQTIITNGVFGELDPKISEKIDAMAKPHAITVSKKMLVTNFPTINAFCARLKQNAEIYISHHWSESPEGPKHLMHILGHEMGHAFYNDPLKRALVNSSMYTLFTTIFFMLQSVIVPLSETLTINTYQGLILAGVVLQIIAMIASKYLQAAYNRYTEYRADAFGATISSPEEMKQALLFLENLNPYDKTTINLPEWKQGAHPKTSNRIARLEEMQKT